jgi:hypothetical protein
MPQVMLVRTQDVVPASGAAPSSTTTLCQLGLLIAIVLDMAPHPLHVTARCDF